jgi:hypothetical protein
MSKLMSWKRSLLHFLQYLAGCSIGSCATLRSWFLVPVKPELFLFHKLILSCVHAYI